MKLSFAILTCLLSGVIHAQPCWTPSANIPLTGKTCGPVQPLQLSCFLPPDTVPAANGNTAQRSADIFSWQEFFALNWPVKAGERGVPDAARPITAPGPRVWETWKESYEVFNSDGSAPGPWNSQPSSPCGLSKVLFRKQKIEDLGIDSTLQAAGAEKNPSPTLTDQKGRLVRYEIRMNRVMFDYIVKNKLYNGITQAAFGPVDLPNGSMLIKAAWREVATPDDESRFYVTPACVCEGGVNGPPTGCRQKRMALVGLHITQRTPTAPQWLWTTFEQRDNVADPGATAPYSFFNPACPGCKPNQQTVDGTPAQLTRVTPIPATEPDCARPSQSIDNLRLLNVNVAAALRKANSGFSHYQLVGTQRPLPPTGERPTTAFTTALPVLANTTMESFVQSTSTCIGCHSTARTSNPNTFASAHFTFQLNNALPQPPVTAVLQLPPTQPAAAAGEVGSISRGKDLVNQTYELLPQYVPTAKLHCTSCHLDNGANSTAAWWVDLKYAYPTKESLEARIDKCFQNSLNGNALCTPAQQGNPGNCSGNADMQSIVKYMEFLTKVYVESKPTPPTPHGFPAIKTLAGDYCSGKATFTQKCAVCHQADGQGRYENGVYFRPALWGPASFNHNAGMFSDPAMLTQFVSWNMPFGSGGQLTDQEAWDIEVFIDSHPRPGYAPPKPPPQCPPVR